MVTQLAAIHDTAQWCAECGQRTERGCNLCKPPAFNLPTFEDVRFADSESCTAKILKSRSVQLSAVFTAVALTVLGITKLFKNRKHPKLTGYEPLPTSVHQVFDYQYMEH